jgi:hypothetical protein
MAIPFKPDHFQLRRQRDLESDVCKSLLYKNLSKLATPQGLTPQLEAWLDEGVNLPSETCPAVDVAVNALRTSARLTGPVEVSLRSNDNDPPLTFALRRPDRLSFSLTPFVLEGRSPQELVHHLAAATFHAFQPQPRYWSWLLANDAPFQLVDRAKVLELLRLVEYAADCFALVCTRDLELTIRESHFRSTGLDTRRQEVDLRLLARHHLHSGELSMRRLLESGNSRFLWFPLKPLVLERFMASALYRTCVGESGGNPRETFEAEVLEMDRQAHPPFQGPSEDLMLFLTIVTILAAFHVCEATGRVTAPRERLLLRTLDMNDEQLDLLTVKLEWNRRERGAAGRRLAGVLAGSHRKWGNLHAVEILSRCLLVAAKEHRGQVPEPVQDALFKVGEWCNLSPEEVGVIVQTFAEFAAQHSTKGKPSPKE